jgi:thiamine biosynthesis lipoprotein
VTAASPAGPAQAVGPGAAPAGTAVPAGMRRWVYPSMGTTLTVLAPADAPAAGPLVKALFDEWDQRFTRFSCESELSLVNAQAGRPVSVSRVFREVTRAAVSAAYATDGLFDPTLGTRIVALGYDRTFVQLPVHRTDGTRLAPWSPGAWRSIEINETAGTVRIPDGAELDFGGIAKGMAVDAALDVLVARGIGPVAVDAGGDCAVRGTPPGTHAWPIELAEAADAPMVWIADGALATSATTRRTWQVGEERRHHLIDPRTGTSSRSGLASVTVAARTARIAEVAAKVALILGPVDGPVFLGQRGLAAVLVDHHGAATPVGSWAPTSHDPHQRLLA